MHSAEGFYRSDPAKAVKSPVGELIAQSFQDNVIVGVESRNEARSVLNIQPT
jgi:hypothetical protein